MDIKINKYVKNVEGKCKREIVITYYDTDENIPESIVYFNRKFGVLHSNPLNNREDMKKYPLNNREDIKKYPPEEITCIGREDTKHKPPFIVGHNKSNEVTS